MLALARTFLSLLVGFAGMAPGLTEAPTGAPPVGVSALTGGKALAPATPSISATDVQAFFDNYIGAKMAENHVAGVTLSVVDAGQVLFEKGYGYSDVARQVPVDPDRTEFVLGSLSKTFTWTAVMQLVEQGKLDLDTDVNKYLDFTIPATYSQKITLNNLMAHNAGFEESRYQQMKPMGEAPEALGQWVKTHVPARIRPPGQYSAYANYNAALAGYIVERASGMTFDDYVEKNILTPLGMEHTTSRQPVPDPLAGDTTQMYTYVGGTYQPQPSYDVTLNAAPAGSFRSTAGDMGRFMLAHLDDGQYAGKAMLRPATAQLMHSRSFTHDPRVNGMAHGFWEMDMNGQRVIGHAGSHFICNSLLMLLPERGLGVFIAANSQGSMDFLGPMAFNGFERAFLDRFFPRTLPALTSPADWSSQASRYTGSYALTMGRSESSPDKLLSMLMIVDVKADARGLIVPYLDNAHFTQVEPLVFRQVDTDALLVFHEDGSGNVTQAFLSLYPQSALVKAGRTQTMGFNMVLLLVWLVLFLSFKIAAGIRMVVRLRRRQPVTRTRLERASQGIGGLAGVLTLVVIAASVKTVTDAYAVYTGDMPMWALVPPLSALVALLTLGMLCISGLLWYRRRWGMARRIQYTLYALSSLGVVWIMYVWNVLGANY
jgi:CubicO group peptidase (beta-lactamase class C family)